MRPEYGLINYGVQTAALERERGEDASFADDGKEYEFLARQTPPLLRLSLAVARGLEGGNFALLSFEI